MYNFLNMGKIINHIIKYKVSIGCGEAVKMLDFFLFVLGSMFGGTVGVIVMCLVQAGKRGSI